MILTICGKKLTPIVEVDGQKIKEKRDAFGNRVYNIKTDKKECALKIYTLKHELLGKNWIIFTFLFYLISVFGIFNLRYSKNYYRIDYSGRITTNQECLKIQLGFNNEGEKALEVLQGEFDDNKTNIYYYDIEAKKRRRMCFLLKILSWILIVVGIIIYLI